MLVFTLFGPTETNCEKSPSLFYVIENPPPPQDFSADPPQHSSQNLRSQCHNATLSLALGKGAFVAKKTKEQT